VIFVPFIIKKNVVNNIEINKSKFITYLYIVSDVNQAKEYIYELKTELPKAVHHCYAYRIDNDFQIIENQSDDGEPSKSAGMPMLDILRHEELINILAVVVRYYGGVKLGVGGLIRAYGSSVKKAVDLAGVSYARLMQEFELIIDYSQANIVEYEIKHNGGIINKIKYLDRVYIYYLYPDSSLNQLLIEKTNNLCHITPLNRIFL
jgi:uncharacterized YigZ family protein